jgi:hypothetical protein
MWNFKTLKIQRTFQNWSKFLELQKSFITYKWGIMYMMCWENFNLLYKKTSNLRKSIFGYDMKLLSF